MFTGRNYVVEDGDIIFFKFNAGAGLKDAKKKWRDKVLLLLVHMLYLNLVLYTLLHVSWAKFRTVFFTFNYLMNPCCNAVSDISVVIERMSKEKM